MYVREHEIDSSLIAARDVDRLVRVAGLERAVPLALQGSAHETAEGLLIVHDEHRRHGHWIYRSERTGCRTRCVRSPDRLSAADDLPITVSGLDPLVQAAVIDAASCLICVFDHNDDLVLYNGTCERTTGFARAEVGNAFLRTLVPPDEVDEYRAVAQALRRGRCPLHHENHLLTKDGGLRRIAWTVTALPGDSGLRDYLVATGVDVTEKRAADRVRPQAILQAVSAGAGRLLLDPFAASAVRALLEELGRAAEVSRAYVFQNLPQDSGPPLHSLRYEWCAEGITPSPDISDLDAIPYFDHWDQRLPTGEVINAHVTALSDTARALLEPQGNLSLLVVPIFAGTAWWGFLGFDETRYEREWSQAEIEALRAAAGILGASIERRRAEEALRESESRFRQFADHVDEAFWLEAPDGRVLYVNRAFGEITGLSPESYPSNARTIRELVHPHERALADRAFDRYLEEPYDIQYRLARSDGSERWVRDRCFHVLDETGAVVRIAGIMLDITDRKRKNEELRRLEEQIRHAQKLESLGILAGGIAHDFNNLLMGVLGNAGLALAELAPGSPVRSTVEQIEKAALRAAELTNQMLAYAGKGRFVVGSVDVSRLVEEIAHLLSAAISKKAVLRFELARDLPPVEADATQLRQVVMNLITNASDALSDETGVITVRTALRDISAHELAGSFASESRGAAGTYAVVEVADTGCGMDAGTIARIFDPFFTTKFTGRGLGLAGALGIVRSHGGAIQVDSRLGEGTCISILLPGAEHPAPAQEATPAAVGDNGEPATVLVVDDEETVRAVATAVLERSGFSVLTAADGREGIDVFRSRTADIDIVLLDMTMPDLGGQEVFSSMRELSPEVRVVVSSGYTEEEARRQLGAGTAGFIQKPYLPQQLVDYLRRALAG